MNKIRVGVIFGGRSGEHEVSLTSARNILSLLDPAKYHVIPIGISKKGELAGPEQTRSMLPDFDWSRLLPQAAGHGDPSDSLLPARLSVPGPDSSAKLDVVFPVLHGPYGEDGTLQGLLEIAGVPYVGSGVLGSALGMDKVYMKRMFELAELPIGEYMPLTRKEWYADPLACGRRILKTIGLPCFIKPANLGSSVGISKVSELSDLPRAIDLAAEFDRKLIVERSIEGRELEISVLGNDEPIASVVGEILPGREFYDYDAKYNDPSSRCLIPAALPEKTTERIARVALRAFCALECRGLARVDFFLERGTRKVLLNEINTMPGFTPISMYQKLWEASGITPKELVDRLVQLAFESKAQGRRRIGH